MSYDIIVIGGGIGGASFATGMAAAGAKVLVLEAETKFRDRVRGEWLSSWGVVEAKKLGVYDVMVQAGGHIVPYMGGGDAEPRDLITTTPSGEASLCFYHPAMQEALLAAAASAGAEVRRGTRAQVEIQEGKPTVIIAQNDSTVTLHPRFVVGADGRSSATRQKGGFAIRHGSDHLRVSGLLFEEMPARDDCVQTWRGSYADAENAVFVLLFPQGQRRVRAYVACPTSADYRLSGRSLIPKFIELFQKVGAPPDYFATATPNGPLASHDGRHLWVEHAYQHGVALIGDAASVTDPTYGQGLSVTMRDARVLRDRLLEHDDWVEGGRAFAEEHARYHTSLRIVETWANELWHTIGEEANERRQKVLAAWETDPTRRIDFITSGPDLVVNEAIRRRYFAEDG